MSQQQTLPAAATLEYTPEVARATAGLAARVRAVIPPIEWPLHAPYIAAIGDWKRRRNAVVLAHNYQTPEIFHGVADFCGDSLALAQFGASTDAEVIVLAGVHFMAETAKILSPEKTVLIPDPRAGCSLAASITGADVRLLRQRYPGVPVVTYVNTSAEVKAESDVCCTSANAVAVVESLGVPRVIFLPDEYLGRYVAGQTAVEVILWRGHCEVHERFTAAEVREFRAGHAGIQILAHPECPPEVLAEADFVGSTAAMIRHVGEARPRRVVMVTECSMSDNVAVEFPDVEFVRPCALCPHMKRITLPKILHSLQAMEHRVELDAETSGRARRALEQMLGVGRREPRERRDRPERPERREIAR
jgi:quinolinate synthase